MILPAMGMVSDIIAVFARKPIFGYRPMVYAMAGIAFLGFIVWAHHMFQSGMNPTLGTTFAISTMFIAVPSAIKTFNWLGTLWGGNIRFTAADAGRDRVRRACSSSAGCPASSWPAPPSTCTSTTPTSSSPTSTTCCSAAPTFGIFAGDLLLVPQDVRPDDERDARARSTSGSASSPSTARSSPMHILGIGGFPRRIADYMHYDDASPHFQPMNEFISDQRVRAGRWRRSCSRSTSSAAGSGARRPPQNPWEATTLEWDDATSPPPHGNFEKVPVVHHGPYEYSSPLVEEDWLPQTRYVEGAEKLVVKH